MSSFPPTKRLYRFLVKTAKPLFDRSSREFMLSTVENLQADIIRLNKGNKIMQKLMKNPQQGILYAFRIGTEKDIDTFLSFLPKILKYTRAIRLIQNDLEELSISKQKSYKYTPYDLSPGGLLIYKLYYSEAELKERNISDIYRQWMEHMSAELKSEVQTIISNRKDHTNTPIDQGFDPSSSIESRRKYIFYVLKALDNVIKRHEAYRYRGDEYEHLNDQVTQPTSIYSRAVAITYSVIYTSLLNCLDFGLQAYGVPYPAHFASRLVLRQNENNLQNITQFNKEGLRFPLKSSRTRSKAYGKLFKALDTVSAYRLVGNWCCSAHNNFHEVNISFNPASYKLEGFAVELSGEVNYAKKLWELPFNPDILVKSYEGKSSLFSVQLDYDYSGVVHLYDTDGNKTGPEVTWCSIRFVALSASLFGPKQYGAAPAGNVHFGIKISHQETNRSGSDKYNVDDYYCRTAELDWCLVNIDKEGVTPITAMQYIEELQKKQYSADTLIKILEPATSHMVAAKLAGYLARSSMRKGNVDALAHGSFWSAVHRQLLSIVKDHSPQ